MNIDQEVEIPATTVETVITTTGDEASMLEPQTLEEVRVFAVVMVMSHDITKPHTVVMSLDITCLTQCKWWCSVSCLHA